MDIQFLCSKFTQKFNVSIQSIVQMRPAEFFSKEKDAFMVSGRGQVSLKSAQVRQQAPPGYPVPQSTPVHQQKPKKETQPQVSLKSAQVRQQAPPGYPVPQSTPVH